MNHFTFTGCDEIFTDEVTAINAAMDEVRRTSRAVVVRDEYSRVAAIYYSQQTKEPRIKWF